MNYTMTTPCKECPFLKINARAYGIRKLKRFASGEFVCHKTAEVNDKGDFQAKRKGSVHCAGALIFLEKRDQPHQMMRIAERLNMYNRLKLDMKAPVA